MNTTWRCRMTVVAAVLALALSSCGRKVDRKGGESTAGGGEAATTKADAAPTPSVRTWTDASGQYSIEAEFMEVNEKEGSVVLKKTDGKVVSVALEKLDVADLEFIQTITARKDSDPEAGGMAWAAAGRPEGKTFTNPLKMEFVLISAGKFIMGSPVAEKGRDSSSEPQHWVRITKPFYMGRHEVTWDQFMAVMGWAPKDFAGEGYPVVKVGWDEAAEFCRKLSETEGMKYRLPTKAEWEYACRAGAQTRFCYGDDPALAKLGDYANYGLGSAGAFSAIASGVRLTRPVAEGKPNAWGLYDMHGNAAEWCQDWYSYPLRCDPKRVIDDPTGPPEGRERVLRGGDWSKAGICVRSAFRAKDCMPTLATGFRVVLEIP